MDRVVLSAAVLLSMLVGLPVDAARADRAVEILEEARVPPPIWEWISIAPAITTKSVTSVILSILVVLAGLRIIRPSRI